MVLVSGPVLEVWYTGLTDDLTHDKRGAEDDS